MRTLCIFKYLTHYNLLLFENEAGFKKINLYECIPYGLYMSLVCCFDFLPVVHKS